MSVRVPGAVAPQTRGIFDKATPLVLGEIAEKSIAVTLTDHAYTAVALADGDLSLGIEDFARQVLAPQMSAIVKDVERRVAVAMKATPETTSIAYDAAAPAKAFTAMRRTLRQNGVTAETPLLAAVGSNVYADLLDAAASFDADGTSVRGFQIVESTRLAPTEVVAYVKNAFALVVRAPRVPEGASHGASVSEKGFALRVLRDYDASVAADRSLVSTFLGVQSLPLPVDNENGTVTLVANGGAVRVDTATAVV